MLFRRNPCHWLKPVRIMGCAALNRPILHCIGNNIRNLGIKHFPTFNAFIYSISITFFGRCSRIIASLNTFIQKFRVQKPFRSYTVPFFRRKTATLFFHYNGRISHLQRFYPLYFGEIFFIPPRFFTNSYKNHPFCLPRYPTSMLFCKKRKP